MSFSIRILFALPCLALSLSGHANVSDINLLYGTTNQPNVSQDYRHLTFNDHIPRVDEVITDALSSLNLDEQDIDWSNSRLFDESAPDGLKQRVIGILTDQYDLADTQTKYIIQGLTLFIQRSHFAHRILTPLDPDVTFIDRHNNPRLKGKWLVLLKSNTHEQTVTIMGNVFNPGIYQWQHRKDARYYLQQSDNLARTSSLTPFVTVIQPDGREEQHSIKQWDTQSFKDIAPGAIIYLPLPIQSSSKHPEDTMEDPNQLIIQLLRSRIQ